MALQEGMIWHPLFDAAWSNDLAELGRLIENGADVHEETCGRSALGAAIGNACLEAIECLLDHGVDPNRRIGGWLPLELAIDLEITASTDGRWEFGCIGGDDLKPVPVLSSMLLRHGADPDLRGANGTPREYAEGRYHNSFGMLTPFHQPRGDQADASGSGKLPI